MFLVATWFNYFQMTKQLDECDNILAKKAELLINYKESHKINEELWYSTGKSLAQLKQRKEDFGKIIELLYLSYIHNLEKTRITAAYFIELTISLTGGDHFLETRDLYDIQAITTLVELSLPLEKDDIHDIELSQKPVFYFDEGFECRDELQKLSLDKINNNKDMLAWIISSHMERRANKLLKEKYESLNDDRDYLAAQNRCLKKANPATSLTASKWVNCDSCGKWRILPPDISAEEVEALPDEWTCADNTWDLERSNCNAEERNQRFMKIYFERKKQAEERMADQPE